MALREEAVSLSEKEAEQFSKRRREINLAAAEIQGQTEFRLWMRYLGEVFPENELAKLVGGRFDGELVEYRTIIPLRPDWHLYQSNIELIRFLISPSVQTELKLKVEQLREINQFNHTKIAEILERETKQFRQNASDLQELESEDSSKDDIDQLLKAKRAQIAVVDKEIRGFVNRVLEDDQVIRLDQLVFQSGLRTLNTRIAFYFGRADESRLDQVNDRLSQITEYGQPYGNVKDLANAASMDFHQTQYMDALEEIIGKRRLSAATGKRLRFHKVDLGLNLRKSKDARQSDNPRRN